VHPDDDDRVPVLLLKLTEFVEDVQAVHATEGPEIQDENSSSQVGEGVLLPARVQPATLAGQFGGTDAGAAGQRLFLLAHESRVHGETPNIRTEFSDIEHMNPLFLHICI
jgi:hypothetical protein